MPSDISSLSRKISPFLTRKIATGKYLKNGGSEFLASAIKYIFIHYLLPSSGKFQFSGYFSSVGSRSEVLLSKRFHTQILEQNDWEAEAAL